MLRFKNYLSEEVRPSAGVKDGGIDIENNAVRGQINATLANVTAQPAVTPYIVLHRISKALAYFHIILPKRAYLEGDRGVEVIEVKQFGHRMGMTNDGQFVHDVPARYFLFISYSLASSMGVDYAAAGGALSSVGGMFKVTAKLVDEVELQRLLSMAEISLAEACDAETQQLKAKAMAPKEQMHTALGDCDCTQGDSPSTKSAISDMMRKKDKKLSADSLDEEEILNEKPGKPGLWANIRAKKARGEKMRKPGSEGAPTDADFKSARNEEYLDEITLAKAAKTARQRNIGAELSAYASPYDYSPHIDVQRRKAGRTVDRIAKKHGDDKAEKVSNKMEKDTNKVWRGEMSEAFGVYRKGGSIGEKPSNEPHKTFDTKDEARNHARGMNRQLSPGEKKYYRIKYLVRPLQKEETLDEISKEKANRYIEKNLDQVRGAAGLYGYPKPKRKMTAGKATSRTNYRELAGGKVSGKKYEKININPKNTGRLFTISHEKAKVLAKEETLDEKLTKAMSAGDVISDFVHSKDPKFKGKSKKMRQKMALGAYYGMHPEKSKLEEMASRVKKTTAHRKLATGVNTKTRQELGAKKEDTKTILVTRKGDPRAAAGGGVRRIPKDKFDPSIYNRASE